MAQTESQTYPNITLKSRAESRFINQQLKYDFVYQLPDDAIRIEIYDSGRAHHDVQKKTGTQIVYLSDSNDRRVDNVILTKVQMKILLDKDSDSRLIENGYYYTSHLTTDYYTKLWDKYKSWAEDENPNLYSQKIYAQNQPKKSKKMAKDDLYQEIAQKQFPFKSKYEVIRKANYYDIPTHQTKNQFDIYPQNNTLEPHDYQLKPLSKFERPYFSPNYNSWEIDQ
ncbi:MAG: hypothetical protein EZS28_036300, partial [Streblomastix strix]